MRVVLREVVPTVVRVIDVPAAIMLDDLHHVLQIAVGWTSSHLHQFHTDASTYGIANAEWEEDQLDERGVRLDDLPARFVYAYDFGDGWEHDIEVLGPGGELPGCVDGEGACPPEDCGGPYGYGHLLAALADPRHPEHASMLEWVGDRLRPFDREATVLRVRWMVGEVPESVRLVLDLLADGVKLTPAGRLPRAVVREVQAQRPAWYPLGGLAAFEEYLVPLARLHDMLREVGLLRLAKGVLRPTKAAGDELQVVRRLRTWFEPGEFGTMVAERAVALTVARGSLRVADLARDVFPLLGHGWGSPEGSLRPLDVERTLRVLSCELEALDLVEVTRSVWSPGPSARSLLPRATLLADLV
ncbi:MAG: plasmid pRiA4b ORF-3 family protein [Actinomycetota bacterium]|nr:plasmid pRiA4b ORF-3 family protein [Actinomycetota bacterium]